jgi:hypothetical protein
VTFSGVKIAVCGHRRLSDLDHLETSILDAARRIRDLYPGLHYQVYSCLAEGADRLLTHKLIEALDVDLIAILPLPEREYLKDFRTDKSIQEYFNLKRLAKEIVSPGQDQTRPQAYQEANRYLMKNCDLLVVIWDGLPARGPGGTAEMVQIARLVGRPMLWIHTGQGQINGSLTEERFDNLT